MLPTNVVSFVKKMVASEGSVSSSSGGRGHGGHSSFRSEAAEAGTTLSKLRHTLTSVTKLSPTRPSSTHDSGISSSTSSLSSGTAGITSNATLTSSVSIEERSLLQKVWDKAERFEPSDCRGVKPPPISTPTAPVGGTFSPLSPPMNGGPPNESTMGHTKSVRPPGSSCRVCVKAISDSEYFKRCSECGQKVCEDCASYSSAKDSEQDTWHCSICRRRLLSRVKKDVPEPKLRNSDSGSTFGSLSDALGGGLTKPSQTFGTSALSLVSGLASMASSLTASAPPSSTPSSNTVTVITNKQSTDSSCAITATVTKPRALPPDNSSSSIPVNTQTPSVTAKEEQHLANGVPRKDARRPSRNVAQKSIERTGSKEEIKDSRRTSTCRRGKEVPHRENAPVTRRRSDNEEEIHHAKPAVAAARRGHRVSDYMLREPSEDQGLTSITIKIKGETDSLVPTNANQRPQESQIVEGASTEVLGGSGESSGEEPSPDGRRGRRRSIVRQKSYDEDGEDNAFLTLWSTGQLPVRRHSAQDPSRKSENPEFQKTKESSLDVPQGRAQRHHSWDYDISRGAQGHDSLLPNANPAQCSRFSSESDMSNESVSERGSMVALGGDDPQQRRPSRASTSRRSSYRATRTSNGNDGQHLGYETEDYAKKTVSSEALAGSGHGDAGTAGGQNPQRRTGGTSSLEDDPWLHPTEDEWRASRRRSSAVSDSGRVLPTPPASPRVTTYSSWGSGSSQVGRSSQSVESASSRDLGDEGLGRQSSIADGEAIKIVIHDVDTDFVSKSGAGSTLEEMNRRRVKIKRDMDDTSHRGGGLGMRIVGGKVSGEGKLMATVVWTVPGGPAERAGIRQGDKVLEWNGVNLVNRSFEDVCSIIEADEGKELVDIIVESGSDGPSGDGRDDNPLVQSQRGSLEARGSIEGDLEKSLMSVSRRKLPRIPGDMHRAPVSGKVQVQMWFDKNNSQFIATVLSAHDIRHREGYVPPEAFVCLRLFPHIDSAMYTTAVADPSTKPLWNSSFLWEGVSGDSLMGMTLELSVWDSQSDCENGFLGECLIDLRHAYLDERPTWFRLQERRSRSANTTPRGSIAGYDFVMPIVRRPSSAKSGSEDYHDIDDSRHSSIDSGLLHPDLAWRDSRSNSRRGSSLSEQAECEVYQLTRSYPHSLPQSRRSSFAVSAGSPEFRGSSKIQQQRQQEEEQQQQSWRSKLGPGQVVPRAYRAILTDDFTLGEIRLELSQTRGHLEVEVSNARGLPASDSGQPPDTYVKTYMKEGDRRMNKRKTRVIKQSRTPNFYQTLRYPIPEVYGRTLLVMVWEKTKGFDKNIGLGVAEIAVNKLELRRPTTGWYRLLPVSSVDRIDDSDSN